MRSVNSGFGRCSHQFVVTAAIEREYGVPIVNSRIAVTPVAQIVAATDAPDVTPVADALDRAAKAFVEQRWEAAQAALQEAADALADLAGGFLGAGCGWLRSKGVF